MTDQILLQLITTISLFCNNYHPNNSTSNRSCFRQIWDCGHNTKYSYVMPIETHNCISKYIKENK